MEINLSEVELVPNAKYHFLSQHYLFDFSSLVPS